MCVVLVVMLMSQWAWAANTTLETAVVGDKSSYVLRSEADWKAFCQLVNEANGKQDVNAIMDADFTITTHCGSAVFPYNGTFNGNGHTLTLDISSTEDFEAPFQWVKNATFKNLHVTGDVRGGLHTAGIVGSVYDQNTPKPLLVFENVEVTASVRASKNRVGGFVGHAHDAEIEMTDCLFQGYLESDGSNDSHAGAFVGWAHSKEWVFHRLYEYGMYEKAKYRGFCYVRNEDPWGYNDKSTLCMAYSGWAEVKSEWRNKTNSDEVVNMMNGEVAGSWGKDRNYPTPLMDTWPTSDDVTFEVYDMVPGTESGEEGTLKMPFSSDLAVKWIEGTYTDQNGKAGKIERVTFGKNTYAGFIPLPANLQHKDLTIVVKLVVGSIEMKVDADKDVVMHNPENLSAKLLTIGAKSALTDAGAVELKWQVKAPAYKDVVDGDQFVVLRSLTGNDADMQMIGSVLFDSDITDYTFKDSTLTSVLTAELLASGKIPVATYLVVRGMAREMWGIGNQAVVAKVAVNIPSPHLLSVADFNAKWASETDHTVDLKWNYLEETGAMWDDRAQMELLLMTRNRENEPLDTTVFVLTAEELNARSKVVQLTRSCVNYELAFRTVRNGSSLPVALDFFEIHNETDWLTFRDKVKEANGQYDVNARLMADIKFTKFTMDVDYRGVFDGGGHTITNELWGGNEADRFMAVFQSIVGTAYIRNLNVAGARTAYRHAAGIVGKVANDATLVVENCRVSSAITTLDAYAAGIVGHGQSGTVVVRNCLFDGKLIDQTNKGIGKFAGAFIGWSEKDCKRTTENCLENGTYDGFELKGANAYYDQRAVVWGGTNNYTYKTEGFNELKRVGSMTPEQLVAALGSGWKVDKDGKVVPKQLCQLSADSLIKMEGLPTFFFENLGHINKDTLFIEMQQTSVVISWNNVTDEPVDYYEVMRCDKQTGKWETLVTGLTDMFYEDKTTSPVHQYSYKVRGVTTCEGLSADETIEVAGMCVQTGTVEGYLRFPDGSGIPGKKVITTVDGRQVDATTDERGFFRISDLPYVGGKETNYQLTVSGIMGIEPMNVTFGTAPGENLVKGVVFEVKESVKLSGNVQYNGTSIPVQGASFVVDGYEVHNGAGKVVTDHEGKFAFHVLKGAHDSIQVVKEGHVFTRGGFYHAADDDPDTKKAYSFNADKAGIMFYDNTRVKLTGRIVGGKTQGEKPLGYALSKNNLGDELKMVLVLEGDHASRLVWDIKDHNKKERDEVFVHQNARENDGKYPYQTAVHTTLNRMVVTPDVHTGEFEVLLPPVKWKIQQITAKGYPTLFQDGQVGDVIDLTDSITLHRDTIAGSWETIGDKKELKTVVEEYHAKYSRIYHSPVILGYRQQGFAPFDYLGDRYYTYKDVAGAKEQLTLAYEENDSVKYTFGYPVFSVDKKYPLWISATEKYYYNNNQKSDTVDVVRLEGGVVTIHNGLMGPTHKDTLQLDSLGEGSYMLAAAQTPVLLTGRDALYTVSMTLLMDGTHYEAEPIKGYVLKVQQATGAKDIIACSAPQLVDILRDPPGGASKATLSKGSTLKFSYTMDLKWNAGGIINMGIGSGVNSFTGVVVAPMGAGAVGGVNNAGENYFGTSIDLMWSGSGQRAFNYTMTAKEDISTSADKSLTGANGDLYIGVEQNIVVKPATAIRAIPDSVFRLMDGPLKAGRTIEIAQGRDDRNNLIHLVRDEVMSYGPQITSDFVHSQHYIVNQLIPELAEQIVSMLYTGTEAEAEAQADATKEPVYLSLLPKDHPDFGSEYKMIVPKNAPANTPDKLSNYLETLRKWIEMIAQNEKEKLTATELVKNFDIDGGSSVSYSETFSSDYSVANSLVSPITAGTAKYFENKGDGFLGAAAVVGPVVAKILANVLKRKVGKITAEEGLDGDEDGIHVSVDAVGFVFKFSIVPTMSIGITPKDTESKSYSRTESFTIGMDKRSHLSFDVYRVKTATDVVKSTSTADVFYNTNFYDQVDYNAERMKDDIDLKKFSYSRSFVYRTRGGATCRPWEDARKTLFYNEGTVMDERTKKIENPKVMIDRQSISGVPYGEPARFKLYFVNESEQPEAVYPYFDIYQVDKANPNGAKMVIDGVPLTGNMRAIEIQPGKVTEKTLEVYAGEKFDYEGLKVGVISQGDVKTFDEVAFDVHYLQAAGAVTITSPGDKWIMNCDAPTEDGKGWYLPVVIGGFNKNQHNFDHIEFQYKETTRGDDYWTNLCGYYADSTLYRAATGTKEMIPENGNIITRFFGDGQEMEKGYDLRAVLFCRNGNAFLTSESKVLSGIKDTRRPQLFGTPQPKTGILGAGDNVIFDFSEDIEYNFLQSTTNFEVLGETNETAIQEAPSLQFDGKGFALTEARRNFNNKNVTIEVMIKPEEADEDMPIFSHGSEGKSLQLWLTKNKHLKAMVNGRSLESKEAIKTIDFQRVALVLDNENQELKIYGEEEMAVMDSVIYNGYGPLVFGAADDMETGNMHFFKGRMLQGRLWYRALDLSGLNRYGGKLLTGYELGLAGYYPLNDGRGYYAADQAQGAHLTLIGASWALPEGMSLKLDSTQTDNDGVTKGLKLRNTLFQRDDEQDYTIMFWFKTDSPNGTLLANGAGRADDEGAMNKFFIGFENHILKYRTNGREFSLGDEFCDGCWHHYAMTVNRARNAATIYVDHEVKAQLTTDSLGGMLGNRFYLGNMVWQKAGDANILQANALSGHIDGLVLFEQALPATLIKRYSRKALGGEERGLLVYMNFDRQEQQTTGELALQPYAMNQVVKRGKNNQITENPDSVFACPVSDILTRIDRSFGAPVQAYEKLRKLNFSFVGRNNQLLVNIDEQDTRINKHNIYVSLFDIPDKNGNTMDSPATESFYVNRNPLKWSSWYRNRKMTIMSGSEWEIHSIILNEGGKSHTYNIENLPQWMTVNKVSDIVEPQSEDEIVFTVNKNLEPGFYDQIIYLTDENGLSDPMYLELTVEGHQPEWYVDSSMKRYSMNMVAQVFVGNTIVTDKRDIVAAFDEDGRCMGVNNIKYDPISGRSMLFMTVYDSTTVSRQVFFRLWHYDTGKIMHLTPTEIINFGEKSVVGTVDNPIRLHTFNLYQQTINLEKGWNWLSFNVSDQSYEKLSGMLNRIPWEEGDIVTEDTEGLTLVYKKGKWISNFGSDIKDVELSQGYSYKVMVQNHHKVELWGRAFTSIADRTMTVKPGWNTLGYTPMVSLPVTMALTDYFSDASPGDVVKSQEDFAMFVADNKGGGHWIGTLEYMKPGEGYMFHRLKNDTVTFRYPYYEPGSSFFETNMARRRASLFPTTMTMVAEATGVDVQEGDRLVAYAAGVKVGETPLLSRDLFFLSIAGDVEAPIAFAIERDGEIIATTHDEPMTYRANAISGSPDAPTQISFTKADQLPQTGWYSVEGIKLPKAPKRSGVYINNGKKHVIR